MRTEPAQENKMEKNEAESHTRLCLLRCCLSCAQLTAVQCISGGVSMRNATYNSTKVIQFSTVLKGNMSRGNSLSDELET